MVERVRKRLSKNLYGNCLICIIWLFVRGYVREILYVRQRQHFFGITKRGNLIHFKTTTERDRLAPYFFQGYFETRPRRLGIGNRVIFSSLWSLIRFVINGY